MFRLVVLAFTFILFFCMAQQTPTVITMDSVMTVQEMRSTGVGELTPSQRAALDHWLTEYTLKVFRAAQAAQTGIASTVTVTSQTYIGTGCGFRGMSISVPN